MWRGPRLLLLVLSLFLTALHLPGQTPLAAVTGCAFPPQSVSSGQVGGEYVLESLVVFQSEQHLPLHLLHEVLFIRLFRVVLLGKSATSFMMVIRKVVLETGMI